MKWRLVSHSAAFFVIWFGLFFAMGQERLTESFNEGWRFHQGDQPAARMERFKDDAWRRVTVPHDWSIEGEFHEANLSGRGGAYLPTGVGWYRKTFTLSASASNRCVRVEFDGVMANSSM
jgi:beta-galactosidase